jgi:hypothetical protein
MVPEKGRAQVRSRLKLQIIRKGAFESKPPNRTDRIPAGGPPHPNSPRENAGAIAAGYDAIKAVIVG